MIDALILIAAVSFSKEPASRISPLMERLSSKLASDALNGPVSGKSMAYLYFIHPFLPPHVICSRLISLLEVLMNLTDDFPPLYLLISELILNFKSSFEHVTISSSESIDLSSRLVKVWADTPECISSVDLIDLLEDILVCFLRAKSLWCSAVIGALSEHSKEKIIARCLEQKTPADNLKKFSFFLVEALVEVFPRGYGAELLRQLYQFGCMRNILESSLLDNALLCILEQSCDQLTEHPVIEVWKQGFITRICNLLRSSFNDSQQTSYQSSFTCLRCLLEANQLAKVELIGVSQAMQIFLLRELSTKSPQDLGLLRQENTIASAILLYHAILDDQTDIVGEIGASVLLYLCTATPPALRVRSAVDSLIGPNKLLSWTACIIESHQLQLNNPEAELSKKIHSMIRSCLRHGLSESQHNQTRSLCLRVVKSFLKAASGSNIATSALLNSSSKLLAAQIFDMISAHSGFDLIFRERRPEIPEVVELLLFCMSESGDIGFDASLLNMFLSAFHAGVEGIDMSLRKILTKYMEVSGYSVELGGLFKLVATNDSFFSGWISEDESVAMGQI